MLRRLVCWLRGHRTAVQAVLIAAWPGLTPAPWVQQPCGRCGLAQTLPLRLVPLDRVVLE